MDTKEKDKIQNYLRDKFKSDVINVIDRPQKIDSMEVYVGDEEDGEVSYSFNMAILDIDL
jgi:hypothetical protein